jgi:hypothetical protein
MERVPKGGKSAEWLELRPRRLAEGAKGTVPRSYQHPG